MIDSSFMNFIESQLSVASKRQQVLSANIANVDTPDYRAQDVTFEERLETLNMVGTAGSHMTSAGKGTGFRMFDVDTEPKPNGNTVDLDRELTEVTKNGLQFVTLMQFLQNKMRTLRSSITDGGA